MFTVKNKWCLWLTLCLGLFPCYLLTAQKNDTAENELAKKNTTISQFLLKSITRSGVDSSLQSGFLISKNEAPYLPYEGKGIRHILVKEFGFDKTFSDTSKVNNYFGKKIISHLHRNTREQVIRHNLFIKEKTSLNPILVADNERYLRSLEYIHDARILVSSVPGEPDSVDLIVITKDFLSITVEINNLSKDRLRGTIGDANLLGSGQKLQFTALSEQKRNPHFGYEILYRKTGIAGTFINATLGYSTMRHDLYDGSMDEKVWQAILERPLISPYLHVAGALLFAHSQSYNIYLKPDSLFYNYHYDIFDTWFGYNLGIHRFLFRKNILSRQFLSIRYFQKNFTAIPYQVKDQFNFRLNPREALLAQFTFFRQNFYKTNYVFGFGITEDIPYGYNIALTAGWYKQLQLQRPYAGADANFYTVTGKGNVIQYFLRTGSFFKNNKIQDATILLGTSALSKVYGHKDLKIRQYLRFSYTKQFNRVGLDPLGVNNIFGLQYISFDSASGQQRLSLHTETIFFYGTNYSGLNLHLFFGRYCGYTAGVYSVNQCRCVLWPGRRHPCP